MAVLSGERWQSSGATTTVTWSFATSNYPSLKTQYSGYRDFSTSINSDFRDEVIAAFNAWEAAANIDFVQVTDSASVNIRIGDYPIDGRAGPGGQSTLGQAHSWWSGTYYKASQIVFDVDAYDSSADFYWTALHEIGHAIGLDHATLSTSFMYYLKTSSSAAVTAILSGGRDGYFASSAAMVWEARGPRRPWWAGFWPRRQRCRLGHQAAQGCC